jgi:hypothetical protein
MKNLLECFIVEFKKALSRKTGWGRNQLLKAIDEIQIKILTEALKGEKGEKKEN